GPMERQGVVHASTHDHLCEPGRKEALEPAEALDLGDLLGDPLLEGLVPLPKLRRLGLEAGRLLLDRVVKRLDPKHRLDAGDEGGLIQRLCQILVASRLESLDYVLRVRLRGDEYDWHEGKGRIRPESAAHFDSVHLWHHHVE